jgi:dipeptidyl aminopeptidase/acylaminoacyl peptidase
VILYHRYDIWSQPLDGSVATNLTRGVGDEGEIRLRLVNLDEDARVSFPSGGFTTEVDLTEPQMLSAFGQWTKKSGFFELPPGDEPRPLVWDAKRFSAPRKAKKAERYLYTVQSFTQFPDYWVAEQALGSDGSGTPNPGEDDAGGNGGRGAGAGGFAAPTRITDANPFQNEYKWGHRILFEYTNNDGVRLQGTLAIPDDYVEGEKRPMIVRFYEKYSQDLHLYPMPMYRHSPNFAGYVSAGYLIMQPDVHFRGGTSHSDMLECVEAATRKVIEMGYADPDAIGLSGHSYSGGGSSFIAGTSDMFAAVASGAAPINLTSEFNQLFLGSGQNNHSYDIHGQGRYGTNPYDDPGLYRQESPITYAPQMNTPLLYLHGEEDMTVGYVQGMEWYNALRFNKKPIIFLSYPGEGHGLRKYENQLDFQRRLREFFNHYLRDMEPPRWMLEGVTYLEKERNLKRRKK